MVTYLVHIHNSARHVLEFQSAWKYQPREKIFITENGKKKSLVISHITHDLIVEDSKAEHFVRLYCQEKKLFN